MSKISTTIHEMLSELKFLWSRHSESDHNALYHFSVPMFCITVCVGRYEYLTATSSLNRPSQPTLQKHPTKLYVYGFTGWNKNKPLLSMSTIFFRESIDFWKITGWKNCTCAWPGILISVRYTDADIMDASRECAVTSFYRIKVIIVNGSLEVRQYKVDNKECVHDERT